MAVSEPVLELRDVSFTYGEGERSTPALDGVSFTVGQSEIVSIVGPSGSGKSTLLKVIAGLLEPNAGEVCIQGRSSRGVHPDVGYVFQDPRLLPWRTVIENVMLPLQVRRVSRPQARLTAQRALAVVGLPNTEQRYPAELSRGMRQRVSIARALTYDPAILLLDEPFAALDAISREKLNLEMLALRHATGKTMVFVTHSITEAVLLGDRVLVLTHRPASVKSEIDVPLGPERDLKMQDSMQFARLTGAVREALEYETDDEASDASRAGAAFDDAEWEW
jgi:NitT/TauT family transport system ATP-binding protein